MNHKLILVMMLAGFGSCTLKPGKELNTTDKEGIKQHHYHNFTDDERNSIKGEKIAFSKLSFYRSDGTIENKDINFSVVFDDKVFDISTTGKVKHFPFTTMIQSFGACDTGIAINMENNNFIRKVFLRKDKSSLIAMTTKQPPLNGNNNQVVKIVFYK